MLPHLARGCHPTAERPSPCQPPAFPSFPRAGGRASGCLRSGKRPGGQGQPFRQRLLPSVTACCLASGLRPTRPALLCSAEAPSRVRARTQPFQERVRARRVEPGRRRGLCSSRCTLSLKRTATHSRQGSPSPDAVITSAHSAHWRPSFCGPTTIYSAPTHRTRLLDLFTLCGACGSTQDGPTAGKGGLPATHSSFPSFQADVEAPGH